MCTSTQAAAGQCGKLLEGERENRARLSPRKPSRWWEGRNKGREARPTKVQGGALLGGFLWASQGTDKKRPWPMVTAAATTVDGVDLIPPSGLLAAKPYAAPGPAALPNSRGRKALPFPKAPLLSAWQCSQVRTRSETDPRSPVPGAASPHYAPHGAAPPQAPRPCSKWLQPHRPCRPPSWHAPLPGMVSGLSQKETPRLCSLPSCPPSATCLGTTSPSSHLPSQGALSDAAHHTQNTPMAPHQPHTHAHPTRFGTALSSWLCPPPSALHSPQHPSSKGHTRIQ